jgi:hypothetical protein
MKSQVHPIEGSVTKNTTDDKEEGKPLHLKLWAEIGNLLPPQTSVDVHDLRKTRMAETIVILSGLTYLIALIFFAIDGYDQLRNQAFLSPDKDSGDCDEASISLSRIYEADANGRWETNPDFMSTKSIYALDMRGTSVKTYEYDKIMKSFDARLRKQGEKCSRRDLSYNMIALASFNVANPKTKMNFYSNARAEKLFGTNVLEYSISNSGGLCKSDYYATYDSDTSSVIFTTSDEWNQDECPQLNRADVTDSLKFDIISMATAIAVNLGMNNVSQDLVRIERQSGYYDWDKGFVYSENLQNQSKLAYYVDPFYDNMVPVRCFNGAARGKSDFCLVQGDKETFFYPMITQLGNFGEEEMCTCGGRGSIKSDFMRYMCSQPYFFVSLVYIPSNKQFSDDDDSLNIIDYNETEDESSEYDVYDFAAEMSEKLNSDDGDLTISKLFHSAQYRSIIANYIDDYDEYIDDDSFQYGSSSYNYGSFSYNYGYGDDNLNGDYGNYAYNDGDDQTYYDRGYNQKTPNTNKLRSVTSQETVTFGDLLNNSFIKLCDGQCTLLTVFMGGSTSSPMNFRGTPVYTMYNNTGLESCTNSAPKDCTAPKHSDH